MKKDFDGWKCVVLKNKNKAFLVCGLVAVFSAAYSYAKTPLFVTQPGPPPGFSAAKLYTPTHTIVDVYFNNKLITHVMATFTNNSIKFKRPEIVADALPGVVKGKKALILKALSGRLAVHESHLCAYQSSAMFCKALSPKAASVIFDSQRYRAIVFINPALLKNPKLHSLKTNLLPSTAGFSASSQNQFLASHSVNNTQYAWNNTVLMADHNVLFNLNNNVQFERNVNGQSTGKETWYVRNAGVGVLSNDTLYRGGMVSTFGGNAFINQQQILGTRITDMNTGVGFLEQAQGKPLPVYLTLPSTVRVYKSGQLLATAQLPAGKQLIDTNAFPPGAYDVKIQVTSSSGVVQTTTHFYVKENALPTKGNTEYDFSAGVLQKNLNTAVAQNRFWHLPGYNNTGVLYLHAVHAFGYNWGVSGTILTNKSHGYLTGVWDYYGNHFEIAPGALVSNKDGQGVSLNSSVDFNHIQVGAEGLKMFNEPDQVKLLTETSDDNQPLTANDMRADGYVNFGLGDASLNLSSNITRDRGQATQKEYNATFSKPLYQSELTQCLFEASVTRSTQDTIGLISITTSFGVAKDLNGQVELGASNNNSLQPTQKDKIHPLVDAQLAYDHKFKYSRLLLAANAHYDNLTQYVGLNTDYKTPYWHVEAQAQNTKTKGLGYQNTFSGEFDSNLVYTDGKLDFAYSSGWQSGVLVDVRTPNPKIHVPVKVIVDNSDSALVNTNEPEVIYLEPFLTHSIAIIPEGNSLYQYSKTPQKVVLYKGNIQHLNWQLSKEYILFTKVISAKGAKIADALLENMHQYDATDSKGNIQAEIPSNIKKLEFAELNGKHCWADIHKTKIIDGYALVPRLKCIGKKT